jgi:hypothetical protein
MQMIRLPRRITAIVGVLIVLSLVVIPVTANHYWRPSASSPDYYHWGRPGSVFTLQVGDNLTDTPYSPWKARLAESVGDWTAFSDIEFSIVAGKTDAKSCKPFPGTLQVCNYTYGGKGWIGLAQIWISGNHITQGTAKLNDTHFNKAPYRSSKAWQLLVMCQEIAHVFGLDHHNVAYTAPNTGSCMDYTNDPDGGGAYGPSNEHPNGHDTELLTAMYSHTDSESTVAEITASAPAAGSEVADDPSNWGRVKERDEKGRPVHYEKDLGGGQKVLTFVIPADETEAAPVDGGTDDGSTGDAGTGDGDGGRNDGGRNDGGRNDGGKRDGAKQDGGKRDGAKQDGGRDGGKRDGARNDGGRDGGGKRDGTQQRQGHDRNRHDH